MPALGNKRRQRMLQNNYGSGSPEPDFVAEFLDSLIFNRGVGSASFARATIACGPDHEGVLRRCVSGEARFYGARRVHNCVAGSSVDVANANWVVFAGGTKIAGGVRMAGAEANGIHNLGTIPGGTALKTITVSVTVRTVTGTAQFRIKNTHSAVVDNFSGNLTATTTPQRFSFTVTNGSAAGNGLQAGGIINASGTPNSADFLIDDLQIEDVTGQASSAPAAHVSVGVLSAPYHGAGVDGVKYFRRTNGNSVASNVVTEAEGSLISLSTIFGFYGEGARTNVKLYSDDMGNGFPTKTNCTVDDDQIASPSGATDADMVTDDATNDFHRLYCTDPTFTAAAWTYSAYFKAGTHSLVQLSAYDGTTAWRANFDISNGTLGSVTATASSTITALPGGWYRCTLTATMAAAAGNLQVAFITNLTDGVNPVYVGTGTTFYVWGVQCELGSFVSSRIPTTTGTVTRNADTMPCPYSGNIEMRNPGAVYFEATTFAPAGNIVVPFFAGPQGAGSDRISTQAQGNYAYVVGGVNQCNIAGFGFTVGAIERRALAWDTNNFRLYSDGVAQTQDTSGDLTALAPNGSAALSFGDNAGSFALFGTIRNVKIWKNRRLSNAQMAAL